MRGIIVLSSACLLAVCTAVPAPTQHAQPVPKNPSWQGIVPQVETIHRHLVASHLKGQKEAAEALGKIGAAVRSTVFSLDAELRTHHDPLVRRACAVALGEIGPSAHHAVGGLRKALRDPDAGVRREAAAALFQIGVLAKAAVPELIVALNDESFDVRERAANTLGAFGPEARAAVPALIAALKDVEGGVQKVAAISLGWIGPDAKAAAPALLEILKTQDTPLKAIALGTLTKIVPKDKKLVPLLVQILKDKDQQVLHFAAARSLGFLGADAREAIPDLIDALKADDFTNAAQRSAILRNILSTLEQFGADAKEAVPIIRVLANDADRGVRDSARRALKKLDPVP